MAARLNTELPEESELTVPELNVSWPVLQTASVYIGKACEWYNNVSCNLTRQPDTLADNLSLVFIVVFGPSPCEGLHNAPYLCNNV